MAKRPTIAATTSTPVMSSVRPNVKRSEPVSVSSPTVVRSRPTKPEARPFRKLASASPARRVRANIARANVSGEPNWSTTSPERQDQRDQHDDADHTPDGPADERDPEGLGRLALPRQLVAVHQARRRRRRARDPHENGRDRPSVVRAGPHAGQHHERSRGVHGEGERERESHGDGAADPGNGAADDPPRDAADHGDDTWPLQRADEAAGQSLEEAHRPSAHQGSHGSRMPSGTGMSRPNRNAA